MIDPRTGQPHPCPMCNSTDVRWRGRRWYDRVLTYARFLVEAALHAIGFGRIGPSTPGGIALANRHGSCSRAFPDVTTDSMIDDVNKEIEYVQLREYYDLNTSAAVATRYWRCRSCRRKGQVFDAVEKLMAPRAKLSALEGDIAARPGAVSRPIDRDGLYPPP